MISERCSADAKAGPNSVAAAASNAGNEVNHVWTQSVVYTGASND